MNYIEGKDGWVVCTWRNVHEPDMEETLEGMLSDAIRMSEFQFHLFYGHRAYRWFASDNTIRVASRYDNVGLVFTPLVKSKAMSHKNDPRKGDLVVFITIDDEKTYGRISYRAEDEVGIFMFLSKDTETWDIDLLESVSGMGSIRWKVAI